jgi:hypothetical protein
MHRSWWAVLAASGSLLLLGCSSSGNTSRSTGSNGHDGGSDSSVEGGGFDGGIQFDGGNKDGTAGCPSTCQSLGANCGPVTDTQCGGIVQCGNCSNGEVCGAGGPNKCGTGDAGQCTPTTCAALGADCGPVSDGCGGLLQCGTCASGQACGVNQPNVCGTKVPDGGLCKPETCADQGLSCGQAGDGCGGTLDCGSCTAPQTCGGGGTPGQCGAPACVPLTCAGQNVSCGAAGDGCGGTLNCGSCTAPKTCGGGNTPGQCGCTGVCAQIPDCQSGQTTTLTGSVYDPAGNNPLYDVLVYVPNNPNDPGLQPFQPGITCDVCGSTAAGDPLVTTQTAVDGTFTLSGVPVGSNIELVIQLGRWRRIFHVNISNACGANTASGANVGANGKLTMPANHTEGDIPRIAILTGGFDPIECVLRKMGVNDSEFTDPGGAGHIQLYTAAQPNVPPNPFGAFANRCPANPYGYGAKIDNATPSQASLFGTTGGQPTIDQYDMVVLACEGYEENNQPNWPNLGAYTSAGGRVFMTDFAYDWMAQTKTCSHNSDCGAGGTCNSGVCVSANNVTVNPAYPNVATWHTLQDPQGSAVTSTIDLVNNPKGGPFDQWLQIVGASANGSGTVALNPVFHNSDSVTSPTQRWLYRGAGIPVHFAFNTPVGAPSAQQCGRAVFSDWHADTLGFAGNYPTCPYTYPTTAPYYSHGMTFPQECDAKPMTPQEAILEFMLFDLSACVQPYQPLCTPETCAQQNIACGPAGDGCGNLIQCGNCPSGQTCGGGGTPGQCGAPTCTPETCAQQNIQCGPAGDGCGNLIQCGNCPAGQTCGGGGVPGHCGAPDGGTCKPQTCSQQNIQCGPAGDGCGGTLQCGTCPSGQTCGGGGKPGQCGSPTCTPETCAQQNIACGPAGDGCGGTLDCGNCPAGEICGLNQPGQCGSVH